MDWTNRNVHPNKVCHVGDEIEVMVLDVDSDRRRVSLGIKQCKANPWEEFAAIHKKGGPNHWTDQVNYRFWRVHRPRWWN